MIVVDSSAVLDLLLQFEPNASWVEDRLNDAEWKLHAPHVIDVEVINVVRHFVLAGELSANAGRRVTRELAGFRLRRYPHVQLIERVWQLRNTIRTSDATFVALAEALGVPLITTDRTLARSHGPRTPVVSP